MNGVGMHKLTMRARYYFINKLNSVNAHLKECEGYRKRACFGMTHPCEEKEMIFYLRRRPLLYNAGRIQTSKNQKVGS